ncbi:hypothetical protein Tco_0090984 [Tanacetum coccineum]
MIACVAKTAQNADFYQIIDFLTGCSINYSLLVDPDLIGPWLQQFWATASLKVINDVPHIRAKVAGKKILISEATIRADLLFDDENGVECFPKQVIWDLLRDIGYEGNLAQLTFSKPLFSPQWKYLVHVLLHCLSPKSTSWEQFGTNIASALVGLATNQKFNFSLMILTGMLGHISNGTPFLMYPRITPLTPSMLEVVTALAAEEEPSTSPHSRAASSARDAQGSPTQSAAHSQRTASVQGTASFHSTANSQGTAEIQGTDNSKGSLRDSRGKPFLKPTNSMNGTLSEEHYVQEEDTADPFFKDIVIMDAAVLLMTQDQEVEHSGPIQLNLNSQLKALENYKMMRRLLEKFQAGLGLQRRKKDGYEKQKDLKEKEATISKEQPSKKPKLRTETIDELRNYLRVVDFEKSVHDKESLEGISMITELQVIDSPDGEYLIIHRENNHFRAFDTLWEILHVLDRQDNFYSPLSSDDDFWKDQEEWEIIRWRFHESSGVHTLEIEDGTMIHMLAERRYPLSRELMIRMLEHGMEVEDESETAITLIHLLSYGQRKW